MRKYFEKKKNELHKKIFRPPLFETFYIYVYVYKKVFTNIDIYFDTNWKFSFRIFLFFFFYTVVFHLSESIRGQTICIIGVRVIEVCQFFFSYYAFSFKHKIHLEKLYNYIITTR